jgi:hypothetical protein
MTKNRCTVGLLLAALVFAGGACGGSASSSRTATSGGKVASTTSTASKKKAAPLSVDPCTTLTDGEVTSYANSQGGEYKVQPPLVRHPVPSYFIGAQGSTTTADPTTDRYCTWVFQQKNSTGATANDGTVEVHISRLAPPDTRPRPPGFPAPQPGCTLFSSHGVRDLTGVGDRAQTTGSIGAAVKGDVCSEISFGGASGESPPADADTVIASVLRRLVITVGTG